jgi:hypothetical protein
MTVSSTNYRPNQYTGSGTTGPFPITWDISTQNEVVVTKINNSSGVTEVLVLTTDYTVALPVGGANAVTLVSSITSDFDLLLERDVALTQGLSLPQKGDFSSKNIEAALDKLTKQNQDQAELIERSVKVSSEVWEGGSVEDIDFVFPSEPGSIPVVDAEGTGLDSITVGDVSGINEFLNHLTLGEDTIDTTDVFTASEVHSTGDSSVGGTLSNAEIQANTAARHAESHTIASHSDTAATGSELNSLTDDSVVDIHKHSKIVSPDGTLDPVVSVDNNGNTSMGAPSAMAKLHLQNSGETNLIINTNSSPSNAGIFLTEGPGSTATKNGAYVHYDGATNKFHIKIGATVLSDRLTIDRDTSYVYLPGGFLGIGPGVPTYSLDMSKSVAINSIMARIKSSNASGLTSLLVHAVDDESYNAANTALKVGKNVGTGRSASLSGTLNSGGADYAEYETKSILCGEIKKGDICGFDKDGFLTDKFSESISFGVKSTNPCIVGDDVWGSSSVPEVPIKIPADIERVLIKESVLPIFGKDDTTIINKPKVAGEYDTIIIGKEESEEDYKKRVSEYEIELNKYLTKLEESRQRVDRIAYSGKVPINIDSGNVGDYVIPVDDNGKIKGMTISKTDITFGQLKIIIGQIRKIKDGVFTIKIL